MFRTSSTLVTGVSSELLSTRFSANLTCTQTARCGGQRAYYEISFTSVFNRGNRLFRCTDADASGGCLQPQYHSGHSDGPWRTGQQSHSGQVLHLCGREERNTCLCQQRMPQGAIVRGEPEESDLPGSRSARSQRTYRGEGHAGAEDPGRGLSGERAGTNRSGL